jgi:hypothetical protein
MTIETLIKKQALLEETLLTMTKSITNLNQHVYDLNRKVKNLELICRTSVEKIMGNPRITGED